MLQQYFGTAKSVFCRHPLLKRLELILRYQSVAMTSQKPLLPNMIRQGMHRLILILGLLCACASAYPQDRAYDSEGNKLSVEECLEQSEIKENQGNYREASWFLNQAALTRWEEKKYNEAIKYFEKSVELNKKVNNEHGIIGIYSNLAMIYADQGKDKESLGYFEKTLEGRQKEGNDKVSVISAHINTAVALNNLKRHNEAAVHLEEALDMAREMSDAQQMRSCYGMLSETYEKAGNTDKSIYYFNLYRTFHEKVQRDKEEEFKEREAEARLRAKVAEAEKKAKELELTFKQKELRKKEREMAEIEKTLSKFDETKKELYASMDKNQLLNKFLAAERKNAKEQQERHELELRQQRYVQYSILIATLGVIIFSAIVYKNYREKKKANAALEERNHEVMAQGEQIAAQKDSLEVAFQEISHKNQRITQSINYAQRIQTAMIPSGEEVAAILPPSFVFFQPRDVVSGDFYWCEEKNGRTLIVAADCTGHGVPGALVSMVGMNLLEQLVEAHPDLNPGRILEGLHQGIHQSLGKGSKQTADGMDIAVATLDPQQRKVLFAGAKNPFVYVLGEEIHVIKGDKTPIGGQLRRGEAKRTFTTHEIDMAPDMRFFLFSDGYQDQFGGENGRKYMTKRFRRLLQQTASLPIEEQQERLRNEFFNWKGEKEQVDDILVIGVEVE